MALTAKQAAYAQARISGLDPSDAYRASYSVENMSPNAIKVEAARLEKHPTVSLTVREAQQKSLEHAQVTADDIVRVAWEIAANERTMAIARVKALELLAKRHHEFSDKHEITGDVRVRMEALTAVAQMTPEQLKALAENARA